MPGNRGRYPGATTAAIVGAGALLLLIPALVNGFPFVYPDTGTYLRSAFQGYVPPDRPYGYGVFLRIASLGGHSYWTMIGAQALLTSYYILSTIRQLVPASASRRSALVLTAMLSIGSSAGFYVGLLTPDIFTPIGIMALLRFMDVREMRATAGWDLAVMLLCCWVHQSNLLILPLCGILYLLLVAGPPETRRPWRWVRLGILVACAWSGTALANLAVSGRFGVSRGGHAFLMARLLDIGTLGPWLQEHCKGDDNGLCRYRDELPVNSNHFLWDASSPLYRQGGWAATRSEYDSIIGTILSEPAHLGHFISAGVGSTAQQVIAPGICTGLVDPDYRRPGSPPYSMITNTMAHGLPSYLGSMQNGGRGELDMTLPDRAHNTLLVVSLLVALLLCIAYPMRYAASRTRSMILFFVGSYLIGCAVCATLSVVDNRYSARSSWMIPMCVGALLLGRAERTPEERSHTSDPTLFSSIH